MLIVVNRMVNTDVTYTDQLKAAISLVENPENIDDVAVLLRETFDAEANYLASLILEELCGTALVLDVGCGDGRTMRAVCDRLTVHDRVFLKYQGIDKDERILPVERHQEMARPSTLITIQYHSGDIFDASAELGFNALVYTSYNTIGMVEEYRRQVFVERLADCVFRRGKAVNIIWNQDELTTEFLREYYPRIGFRVLLSHHSPLLSTTVLSKGGEEEQLRIDRPSVEQIIALHEHAGIKGNKAVPLGKLWVAVEGTRE
jgi:SAM-dependent methyltransferase